MSPPTKTTSADRSGRQGLIGFLASLLVGNAHPPPKSSLPPQPNKEIHAVDTLNPTTTGSEAAVAASLENKINTAVQNVVTKVETAAETIWNDIKTGVTILKDEGEKVVNFLDTEVPGAAPIIQQLILKGEQGAATLAANAENGLKGKTDNLAADAETMVVNLLQALGLVSAGQKAAVNANGIAIAKSLVNGAIDQAFVKGLAGLAAAL